MYTRQEIINKLQSVCVKYPDIRVGLIGSYARNEVTEKSDIDVLVDGVSQNLDVDDLIESLFDCDVDVVWLYVAKQFDEEMGEFCVNDVWG